MISFVLCVLLSNLSSGMYNPEAGRFIQRDPLGVNPAGGGINKYNPNKQYSNGGNIYSYAKSNPVIMSDSYGLSALPPRSDYDCCLAATQTFPPDREKAWNDYEKRLRSRGVPEEEIEKRRKTYLDNYALITRKTNAVICCDGRKVSCPWRTLNDYTQTGPLSIAEHVAWIAKIACADVHERTHFIHTPECPQKCTRYVSAVKGYRDRAHACDSEYEAYKAQINCLQSSINLCQLTGNSEECEKIINDDIEAQRSVWDTIYSDCGKRL